MRSATARRMVDLSGELDDAVAEADARRSLGGGREQHLGRAAVGVLLEEVVLDRPHVVDADAVRELDLLEGLLHDAVLRAGVPRTRQLELVEHAEPHGSGR